MIIDMTQMKKKKPMSMGWIGGCWSTTTAQVAVGRGLTNEEKEAITTHALSTDHGRALAQAMVEPIRRTLDYQRIGRKLFMVDELPQGALARYERDVAAIGKVIARVSENT